MSRQQRTLAEAVELSGTGLHEGQPVTVHLAPARAGAGIHFVRADLADSDPIPATIASVVPGERRTLLRRGAAEVHTVEHLLAALWAFGVDNLEVTLDGPELPALDGSARPWVEALARAGLAELRAPRRSFTVREPIVVEREGATLAALPPAGDGQLDLSYTLDYRARGLAVQHVDLSLPGGDFAAEVAPARTFVFADEASALRAAGLGRGATPENTVVFGADGEPVEGKSRLPEEPARHKLLDLVGDLALLGCDLSARVVALKSGHALHHELVRRLAAARERAENAGRLAGPTGMDIREIAGILPHRYPFLLVDRVIEIEGYRRAVGIKNVTINEPFFAGHFPDQPIMPGVLILEALAQLAGTLVLRRMEYTGKLPVLWAIDKVKLRRSVIPGDQLRLEVEAVRVKDTMARVDCIAKVDQHVAAEAQMTFTLVDAA